MQSELDEVCHMAYLLVYIIHWMLHELLDSIDLHHAFAECKSVRCKPNGPHNTPIHTTQHASKLYGFKYCAGSRYRLVGAVTHLQACALYSSRRLKLVQQAIHIQQLLDVSPRNPKQLFNRVEMKQ